MTHKINKDIQRSLDEVFDYIEELEKTKENLLDTIRELRIENEKLKIERDQLQTDCDDLTNENMEYHNLYESSEQTKKVLLL